MFGLADPCMPPILLPGLCDLSSVGLGTVYSGLLSWRGGGGEKGQEGRDTVEERRGGGLSPTGICFLCACEPVQVPGIPLASLSVNWDSTDIQGILRHPGNREWVGVEEGTRVGAEAGRPVEQSSWGEVIRAKPGKWQWGYT